MLQRLRFPISDISTCNVSAVTVQPDNLRLVLLLGVIWAPCVGPTLGVAIAAASQGENLLSSMLIFLIFGLGVAASILVFAYGSRRALKDRSRTMQSLARYAKPIFGLALLMVGLMVVSGFDKVVETAVLDALPSELVEFTTRF